MPMFVRAGSARTQATSPGASACSSASASFHWTTFVVSARIDRRADVARSGDDAVAVERRERLVDGAVVAVVEDEDLRPLGDLAREPDREAVRIRRREGELPAAQPEAARQLLGRRDRVLAREHRRDAPRSLLGDRCDGRRRRVPRHRARVAEAEVDVLVPVHVDDPGAGRLAGGRAGSLRPTSPSSSSGRRRGACPGRARRAPASADSTRRSARARARAALRA